MPTVLLIDDNAGVIDALALLLSLHDIDALRASTPGSGLALLADSAVDLVIQDMNFSADTTSGAEGETLFRKIRTLYPDMPVVLLTAWTHLSTAVELVRAGAADYQAKPWDDRKLVATVRNLLELGEANRAMTRNRESDRSLRRALKTFDLRGYLFADAATARAVHLACQVARADVPVLITGPNGAGKEGIASIVQANSGVCAGPFITVNCGALPSELIEAELFGAEAGAYTGANKAREGKFEAADGGTLFLDEIGNLPLAGQMKLLRVLETGRFTRLGANREREVKVRVISATNADLRTMIRQGRFREDLYYRLNLIEIVLPPLAERSADILPLAEHFLGGDKRLADDARAALLRHHWPGNVRELKNTISRARLLAPGDELHASDLGLCSAPVALAPGNAFDRAEPDRDAIEAALTSAQGVVAQAAAELGLSRQALYRRMERLGIGRAP
ncbi:MAG: sigma-54 dependent transcriptional regulator [Pseudomonadota bacterium]|nr:sigma-54 dependent transcriptional regulator [Pseudomonadota bacterium]